MDRHVTVLVTSSIRLSRRNARSIFSHFDINSTATAAHVIIRYSKRMKAKYLSTVIRLGKNRAIVAIARILLECIYIMLTRNIEFEDNIDSLTERKMKAMSMRAKNPRKFKDLEEVEKIFMNKRDQHKTNQLFS